MSQQTKIEWTETTWNPITGCDQVSEGCKNCYALTLAKRLQAMGNPRYKNGFKVTIHDDLIEAPLSWRQPRTIFVNSMSDIFHEKISDEVILRVFKTMNDANWHRFQVLTKRIERLESLADRITWTNNIWMGVTVENKNTIYRSDILKECNAHVKFISAEPLLESISEIDLNGIDWIIVGGESGPRCRPMDGSWVLELKDKAQEAGTAFFFKQWGGFPKNKAGNLLFGEKHQEFPQQK